MNHISLAYQASAALLNLLEYLPHARQAKQKTSKLYKVSDTCKGSSAAHSRIADWDSSSALAASTPAGMTWTWQQASTASRGISGSGDQLRSPSVRDSLAYHCLPWSCNLAFAEYTAKACSRKVEVLLVPHYLKLDLMLHAESYVSNLERI